MSGRLPPIGRATGLALVASLLVAPSVRAQAAYVLERSSSRVMFQGRAFLRSVVGRSDDLVGMLSIRRGDLRSMRGTVRFPITSLETDPVMQAKELREVFGGDVHPEIVFLVDSIGQSGPGDDWAFHGRLTMNGVTRPVVFRGQARITANRMTANGTTDVDLHDWRIRPPRRLGGLVGMSSKIRLMFRAEFRPREDSHTALAAPEGARER